MRGAVVLAGGEAKRFGGLDKMFLQIQEGITLIEAVVKRLDFVDEVVVATNNEEKAKRISLLLDVPCLIDSYPGILGGILSGLRHLSSEEVLVLGGDMPLVNSSVVNRLFSNLKEYEAAVPIHPNGFIEPLHGVLRRSRAIRVLPKMGAFMRVRRLYEDLNTAWVPVSTLRELDPELLSFTNVNDPIAAKRVMKHFT